MNIGGADIDDRRAGLSSELLSLTLEAVIILRNQIFPHPEISWHISCHGPSDCGPTKSWVFLIFDF